ncbi:MAG: GtrA family protein [Pseudomonadota bacterium]|nr:GtrA family protein [Pseudomonadota bacterium]
MPSSHSLPALLRYGAVGAVATAAHYGLLALLAGPAGWWPPLAAAAGAWLGAQVAYLGNARFTFAAKSLSWRSWILFQLVAGLGVAISFACVAIGMRLGSGYWPAQLVATACTVLLTFWINARWTFTTPGRG